MQGTTTVADTTVTFVINDEDRTASLYVQDGLSGKQWAKHGIDEVNVRAALIVMLDGDGHPLPEELYTLAEAIQPEEPELRFIP